MENRGAVAARKVMEGRVFQAIGERQPSLP